MNKNVPAYSQAPKGMIWGLKIAILVQVGDTIKFVGKALAKREDNRYVYFVTEKYADEMKCLRSRFMKVLRKDEDNG